MTEANEVTKDPGYHLSIARIGLWQAIGVAAITAISGGLTAYYAIPPRVDPQESQGVKEIGLSGKWKYICTSFDGSYQHGGRFEVRADDDGALFLSGERMWRDTKDAMTGNWTCRSYKESDFLQWHSNWIFVRNNTQMNFEYTIPMVDREVKGYATGAISTDVEGRVTHVRGQFYVLNNMPVLTGQIIFRRVSEEDYHSTTTLPKNH